MSRRPQCRRATLSVWVYRQVFGSEAASAEGGDDEGGEDESNGRE
ncbi:hypothetical protein ACFPYI_15945 [Halomarina salina]|uniref:Uncharacterized protein n=1 Tax=Halomarina salina TaxID=1872699 RepID=A0ABD5RQJ1_9EURY|nr:hypothetical protein [Halomarina salina]